MKKMKIKEFAEVISGSTPKTNVPEYWNGDYCWITPAEICSERKYIYDTERKITIKGIESSNLKELKEGTVLLTSRAPIGKVAISKINIYCNQGFKAIVCNRELAFPDYIYYWLCANNQYLNSLGRGATFKEISKKIVEDIEVPLPDLNKQVEIANILDQAQELIDKRKAQIEALDELIQSVFYEIINKNQQYDLIELNKIIDKLSTGKSYSGEEESQYKVLKTSAVSYEFFDETQVKNLPLDYIPLEEHLVKKGDLLISRMNTTQLVGAVAYVNKDIDNIALPDRIWKVHWKCDVNPIYVWYCLNQKSFRNQLLAIATGTSGSMKNISQVNYLNQKIPMVSLKFQNQFGEIVENIEKQKELLNESLVELENNFNSLMQRAFNGEPLC